MRMFQNAPQVLKLATFFGFVAFVSLLIGCTSSGSDNSDSSGGGDADLAREACGVLGLTRIINGGTCAEPSSPVVRLTIVNSDGLTSLCSGVLLTSDDVLTAAHCFLSDVSSAFAEINGQVSPATSVVIHPDLRIEDGIIAVFNDAAILRLANPLNSQTMPVVVSRDVRPGDVISIFGFGLNEDDQLGTLRSGEMQVNRVTNDHVFAPFNGDGSNTCKGDSGGPAVLSFVDESGIRRSGVVGVVSTGNLESCREGDVSLFANVQAAPILDFISSTVPDFNGI